MYENYKFRSKNLLPYNVEKEMIQRSPDEMENIEELWVETRNWDEELLKNVVIRNENRIWKEL